MFDEARRYLLLSKLLSQPNKGNAREIWTKATHKLNLVKIENGRILVATDRTNFGKYKEVPFDMIETVYNELERTRVLSQEQISKGLNIKRSAFIITALSLLPEIKYDRASNSLKFTGLPLGPSPTS